MTPLTNEAVHLALDFLIKEFPGEDWSAWEDRGLGNIVVTLRREPRRLAVPCIPSVHQMIYEKAQNRVKFKEIEVPGGEYASYLEGDELFEFIPRKLPLKEKMRRFAKAMVNPSYCDLPDDDRFNRERWILTSKGRGTLMGTAGSLIGSADRDQRRFVEAQIRSA